MKNFQGKKYTYIYRLNTKIRLTMLCLSGFELYSRWLPLKSQPMFSDHEASQKERCEPFDFPTRISAGFPCPPGILKSLNQNQFLNFSIKTRPCITESGHFKIL